MTKSTKGISMTIPKTICRHIGSSDAIRDASSWDSDEYEESVFSEDYPRAAGYRSLEDRKADVFGSWKMAWASRSGLHHLIALIEGRCQSISC